MDSASLSGAVVVSLVHAAIGVMVMDEALIGEVRDSGYRAGERCWPLPLWDDYRELLKSDVADIKNSGGRAAGTIAGAWFLRDFVDSFQRVHLDIPGPAYLDAVGAGPDNGPTEIEGRRAPEILHRPAR